jgi:hypothetical protein
VFRHHNYSLEKAYEYLLERRPIAAPNYGFLLRLIRYEKEIGNKNQTGDTQNPIKSVENLTTITTIL